MFLNVRDFGATGVNANNWSDTDAFKAAIQHIRNSSSISPAPKSPLISQVAYDQNKFSSTIFVPRGEYRLLEPIEIPLHCSIVGESHSSADGETDMPPKQPRPGGPKPGGTTLLGAHDKSCIIRIRSGETRIENLRLYGDINCRKVPQTAILIYRNSYNNIMENILVRRVVIEGSFSKAGICSIGAERALFDQIICRPTYNSTVDGDQAKYAFWTSATNALGVTLAQGEPPFPSESSNGYSVIRNSWLAIDDPNWETVFNSACLRMVNTPGWSIQECYFTGTASASIDLEFPKDENGPIEFTNCYGEGGIQGQATKLYHILIRSHNPQGAISLSALKIDGIAYANPKNHLICTYRVALENAHISRLRAMPPGTTSPTVKDDETTEYSYGYFQEPVNRSFIMVPQANRVKFVKGTSNVMLIG